VGDTPKIVLIVALAIAGTSIMSGIITFFIRWDLMAFAILIAGVLPSLILSIPVIIFLVKGLRNDDFSRYPCGFFSVILILWSLISLNTVILSWLGSI